MEKEISISLLRAMIQNRTKQIDNLVEAQAQGYHKQYNARIFDYYSEITLMEKQILDRRLNSLKKKLL